MQDQRHMYNTHMYHRTASRLQRLLFRQVSSVLNSRCRLCHCCITSSGTASEASACAAAGSTSCLQAWRPLDPTCWCMQGLIKAGSPFQISLSRASSTSCQRHCINQVGHQKRSADFHFGHLATHVYQQSFVFCTHVEAFNLMASTAHHRFFV